MFKDDCIELYNEKKIYLRKSTVANYSSLFNNLIFPSFEDINTNKINNKLLNEFVLNMLEKGYSIKYIKDAVKLIEQVLYKEMENENIPFFKVKVKYPSNIVRKERNKKSYSIDEAKEIFNYCMKNIKKDNRYLGIILSLELGLRIGEVCGLKYSDLNFKEKTITINSTVERIYDAFSKKTMIVVSQPKTLKSKRVLPLNDRVLELIPNQNSNTYLLNNKEKPIEPRSLGKFYKKVIEKINIEYVNFHGLRHTFASILITNGVDIKTVSELLGHANISTTLSIYAHSDLKNKNKAINKLGGLLDE